MVHALATLADETPLWRMVAVTLMRLEEMNSSACASIVMAAGLKEVKASWHKARSFSGVSCAR